jgi:polyisoprenoid-binding protein YceI
MARYRIVPERSRIEAEARSSLHPIRVETVGLEGYFDAEIVGARLDPSGPPSGCVEIDADRLKTGNGLYDRELERRLEIRKYPRIRGEVRGMREVDSGRRYVVRGDLTFHGVTHPEEGEVGLRTLDERTVEIEGQLIIDMRNFGLEPPRLLMLKVEPDVRVRGRVVAQREG